MGPFEYGEEWLVNQNLPSRAQATVGRRLERDAARRGASESAGGVAAQPPKDAAIRNLKRRLGIKPRATMTPEEVGPRLQQLGEAARRGAGESAGRVARPAAKTPEPQYKNIEQNIDLTLEGRRAQGLSKQTRLSEEEVISLLDDHQIPWDAGDMEQVGIRAGSPEHGYKTLKNPTVQQMMDWLGY